jgi:hypothetical protein
MPRNLEKNAVQELELEGRVAKSVARQLATAAYTTQIKNGRHTLARQKNIYN